MARPRSKPGINPTTERNLVWWLAKGYGPEEAAKRAGLPSTARLYHLKRTTAFADELRQALKDHLASELAPKAVRILDELMSDTKTPARVRVDAAKTLLDRAGFTPAAIGADGLPSNDDMSTWTKAQLQAFVEEGERQLAREVATDADFEDVTPDTSSNLPVVNEGPNDDADAP
jgi:hypothetical protein